MIFLDPKSDPVLADAFDVLKQGNWSKRELEAYDLYLDSIRSAASQLDTAEQRGEAKGIIKGRAEGEMFAKIKIAKDLLEENEMNIPAIAKITKLSIEEIEKLRESEFKK